MKNKFRSYGFWTALAGAVVMLLNALGSAFGFSIDDEVVTGIIMAVAGVLVVLGVVSMPKDESQTKEDKPQQEEQEIEQDNDKEKGDE